MKPGSEEELRIPKKEEEIEISKHPVQVAEVSLTRRQVEEMQHVQEMVKMETFSLEIKGTADVKEQQQP